MDPNSIFVWVVCVLLGVLTVAFAPLLIGSVVKILTNYARKYPAFTDVVAVITVIIVGAVLLAMSAVFAVVYHHLIVGIP